MPMASRSLDELVTALVASLSRSLAEQFNVFRVMHHGTHEKQLSNVFAWLLRTEATHELGDAFQRLFVGQVNRSLRAEDQLPTSGYAELLGGLKALVTDDLGWQRTHAQQNFFVNQLIDHFVEVPGAVSSDDRIAFIKTMCETGESARYGYRPQEQAVQEFADLVAGHAKRQFEEGRKTLAEVKRALKGYAENTLIQQVNGDLSDGRIDSVQARFVGQWEWCVTLRRADSRPTIFLEFGPTAVVENGLVPEPLVDPDYTKVFVTRQAAEGDGLDLIHQSPVGLDDVLAGLSGDDTGLRNAVLDAIAAN